MIRGRGHAVALRAEQCVLARRAWVRLSSSSPLAEAAPPPRPPMSAVVVNATAGPEGQAQLGFAMARRFATWGMDVGLVGASQEPLDVCRAAILDVVPGANVLTVTADTKDKAAIESAFSQLREAHGPPLALVTGVPPVEPTAAGVDDVLKATRKGHLDCCVPAMRDMLRAEPGQIFIRDDTVLIPRVTKGGTKGRGYMQSLKQKVLPYANAPPGTTVKRLAESLASELSPNVLHSTYVVFASGTDGPWRVKPPALPKLRGEKLRSKRIRQTPKQREARRLRSADLKNAPY